MPTNSEKDTFQSIKNVVKPFFDFMVDIQSEGLEHIPAEGPAILVGNHRSDMDPFVVASKVPRYISWIAARYTEQIPLFNNLTRATGVIPMDIHGNVSVSSIKKLMSVLRSGDLLGIFPEGHDYIVRNDFSAPLESFHEGFGIFAYRGKAPVIPFTIIPLEEEIQTMPLPSTIRKFMGLPEEVCAIPHRVQYRKVKLVVNEPIPYASFGDLPEKEAVSTIVKKSRTILHSMQVANGMLPATAQPTASE
ncbi:MAG: 1-acyl-sn-glycerol-3-phosphate acyltransferase [Leptospiraceae bacterium]|nr:1-acyl-sn-glycerol-3-phosphate acyltransferase [Leptospiraceae bacterium]